MSDQPTPKKTIEDLRAVLFETITGVRNGAINIEKARQISDLANVLVSTAKVEVDFLRVTGTKNAGSAFIGNHAGAPALPAPAAPALPVGITGVRQYRTSDVETGAGGTGNDEP